MKVNKVKLYKFLKDNGCNYLYHANTVRTACSFIKKNGILSRGGIKENKLVQTPQNSDSIDKKYGVWNDIFLDIVDLHGYFPRQNLYGPVLFKYKVEVLLGKDLPEVWITKDNPIYWNDEMEEEDKYYYLSDYIDEFEDNFGNKTIQQKMITLRKTYKPLSFNDNLDSIILDNTKMKLGDISLYRKAKETLSNAIEEMDMDEDILVTRNCNGRCYCRYNYLNCVSSNELRKLFL